ncbi:MAG: transglycosylase SLT domain-containing protein [Bacteroidales bacterium]|nr:transglycosylase SLT domain-containing protein [Bacteroidales bacterium]
MKGRPLAYTAALILLLLLIPHKSRVPSAETPEEIMAEEPTGESLSSYDKVIKATADTLGMDWHLIAAVVYHESRFHNEAMSARGAVGLMQILSSRYSEEYLLVPANNLMVGSRYLKRLQKMYSTTAANPTEALKFALAAYNFGEGKVWRLIKQTQEAGEDASRWDVVASTQLPKGHHTVAYVEKVLDTYADYYKRY